MFSGIEKKVRHEIAEHSKYRIERNVQKILPIGSSLIVRTNDGSPGIFLICAPTMVFPNNVAESRNAFAAMSAVLNIISKHNRQCGVPNVIDTIYVPGLCTGVGRMTLENALNQIMEAIIKWKSNGSLNAMSDDAIGVDHVFFDESFLCEKILETIDLSDHKYIKIVY